uniref:Uncharacterized protein n=1 Tax=viral metagenome TaxID=1070528 RepID=A0A6C0ADI7_9ZZZZ
MNIFLILKINKEKYLASSKKYYLNWVSKYFKRI